MPNTDLTGLLRPDAEGNWPLVIVPSGLWKRQVPRILARQGINTFGLRVDTLSTLAQRLAGNQLLSRRLLPLTRASSLALVIRASRNRPGMFLEDIPSPGFSGVLLSTIDRLRCGLVSPGDLRGILPRAGYHAERLRSLADIYEEYLSLKVSSGLYDHTDMLAEAADLLDGKGYPETASGLFILGHHLNCRAEDCLVRSLQGALGEAVIMDEPFASGADSGTALEALKTNLFRDTKGSTGFDDSFRILACHGEPGEAGEAIRQVLERAGRGADYQRQAILLPRSSPWSRVLKGLASRSDADIPLDLHAPPPLAATRPGRALTALLELAEDGLPASGLFDLLRSGLVRFDEMREGSGSGYLQFLCREGRIVGGTDWKQRLSRYSEDLLKCADAKEDTSSGQVERRKYRRRPEVLRRDSALVLEFQKAVLRLKSQLDEWISIPDQSAFFRKAAELLETWHPSEDHLTDSAARTELLRLLRSVPDMGMAFSLNQLGRILGMMLEQPSPPESDSSGLLVTSIASAAGLPYDSIVIMGLTERVWPPPRSSDPFLPDELAGELGLVTAQQESEHRRRLLGASCRAAGSSLRMTYAAVKSNEFSPGVPSSHALSAEEAITGNIVPEEDRKAVPPVALDGKKALDGCEFWLGRALGSPGTVEEALVAEGVVTEDVLRLPERRRGKMLTDWDGLVGPGQAAEALRRRYVEIPSPTGFEAYAEDPLHFLYTHLMRLEVLEEPEEQDVPESRELGTMAHEVLELYLRGYRGSGFPPDTDEQRQILLGLTAEVFDRYMRENNYMNPLQYRLLRISVGEALLEWLGSLQHDAGGYEPFRFELTFGLDGIPPATITLDGKQLRHSGRIDRVDRSIGKDASLRIIDYKSGKCYINDKDLAERYNYGRNLQLGCYAVAASASLNEPVSSAGYTYLDVGHSGSKAKRLTIEWDDDREKELMEILSGLLRCIRSGFFPPGDGRLWTEEEKLLCGLASNRIKITSEDPAWKPYQAATRHPELPEGGDSE